MAASNIYIYIYIFVYTQIYIYICIYVYIYIYICIYMYIYLCPCIITYIHIYKKKKRPIGAATMPIIHPPHFIGKDKPAVQTTRNAGAIRTTSDATCPSNSRNRTSHLDIGTQARSRGCSMQTATISWYRTLGHVCVASSWILKALWIIVLYLHRFHLAAYWI